MLSISREKRTFRYTYNKKRNDGNPEKWKMASRKSKPCFVFNCNSSYNKENGSIALFHPPKLCLNSWQEIIRKPGLTCKSKICSIHFEENDIVKGREILGVFHSYSKWKLKSGALPSKLLGILKFLLSMTMLSYTTTVNAVCF